MGTGGDAFDEGGEGFGSGFLFEGGGEIGFAGAFGGAGFEFAEFAVVGFFDVGGGSAEDGGDGEGFVFEIGDVDEVGVRLEGGVHGEVREGVELAGFVGFGGDEGDDGSHQQDECPMEAEGETSEKGHGLRVRIGGRGRAAMRMLGKDSRLLGVGREEEGDAVVDGEDTRAVLAGEGGLGCGGDSGAGAFFGGGPAEGLVGVRAAELGEELVDPGGVGGFGHGGEYSSGAGWVQEEMGVDGERSCCRSGEMKKTISVLGCVGNLVLGAACSLVTVPVKTVGSLAETTVKTAGGVVEAPFKAMGGRGEEAEKKEGKKE